MSDAASTPPFTRPRLRWAGPTAFLLECADLTDVMALHAHLRAHPLPGQQEVIAAAETVFLGFRGRGEASAAARRVGDVVPETAGRGEARRVTLDVVYDGDDLAAVAEMTGMSVDAVVAAHTAAEYVAAFGGFAPGFAYCTAEPAPFDLPRRSVPRTAVPEGSVALAGVFSAVYPRVSPGGWQLIGRTDARLWDLDRAGPALIRPGDSVRHRAVRALATLTAGETSAPAQAQPPAAPARAATPAPSAVDDAVGAVPGLLVVQAGPQALIQDLGRHGHGDLGVAPSGAADRPAARQANRLVGNASAEAVVEALLGGLVLRAHGTQVLALTGAEARGTITAAGGADVRPAPLRAPFALLDGETLSLDEPAAGLRTYVALRGGIDVPEVLGSRATDVMSGIGPSPLTAGAQIARRVDPGHALVGEAEVAVRVTPTAEGVAELRVVLGPRDDWFDEASMERLTTQEWRVTTESNRIGLRLAAPEDGAPLTRSRAGELASEGVVPGSLQIPPSGQPVLFLADHPVTGGYPVIAVVVPEDLGTAAQLPPGARVRLVPVSPADPAQEA